MYGDRNLTLPYPLPTTEAQQIVLRPSTSIAIDVDLLGPIEPQFLLDGKHIGSVDERKGGLGIDSGTGAGETGKFGIVSTTLDGIRTYTYSIYPHHGFDGTVFFNPLRLR